MTTETRRWKERAAGAWADCILIDCLPGNGIKEGILRTISDYLQMFYVQERTITVSQDDRGVSGKSSWGNLFTQMDIEAAELVVYGGSRRLPAPTRKYGTAESSLWIRTLRPGLVDALVENRSISLGFSAAEFAASIILCGFRPGDFRPQSSRHSTSRYGQIFVAEYHKMIKVENVRISLAAAVGSRLFFSIFVDRGGTRALESFQQNMRKYLERCYLQAAATEKSRNAP